MYYSNEMSDIRQGPESPVLHLSVSAILVQGRVWAPEGQDVAPRSPQEHSVQTPGSHTAGELHPPMSLVHQVQRPAPSHPPHEALLPGDQHHGELSGHGPAPEQLQVQDGGGSESVAEKINRRLTVFSG